VTDCGVVRAESDVVGSYADDDDVGGADVVADELVV
jgi:hypothetical protein